MSMAISASAAWKLMSVIWRMVWWPEDTGRAWPPRLLLQMHRSSSTAWRARSMFSRSSRTVGPSADDLGSPRESPASYRMVAGRAVIWTPMLHPNRASMWNRGLVGYGMRSFDAVVPQVARFVDAIVAATDEEAYRFRRLGCRLVEVIPPAVDEAPLLGQHDASIFRRRYSLGRGPLVLIVAARDERRKGLGFAIEVFSELKNQVLDARLAVVGLPRPRVLAGGDDVHFLGRIP